MQGVFLCRSAVPSGLVGFLRRVPAVRAGLAESAGLFSEVPAGLSIGYIIFGTALGSVHGFEKVG
jgi:hypothetical protein